jgi:GNAT superfamily N-acetyltransferase
MCIAARTTARVRTLAMPPDATLTQAVEVFVHGFCFTRSFTHPYVPRRIAKLWVLRDRPRSATDPRTEEWISCGVPAAEIDRIVRARARGNYMVCAIVPAGQSADILRAEMKGHGFRLMGTEALMVRSLARVPRVSAPARIARVTTAAMADDLAQAARCRQILPEHVAMGKRAPIRAHVALIDEKIVGWVRSISAGRASWAASMYVAPAFRRRGIGRAVLAAMLRDDRRAGSRRSVLLASHAGEQLYAAMDYEKIGTLYLFRPVRHRRGGRGK